MREALYVLLGTYLGVCRSQYISINPRPSKLGPCDNLTSKAYIEHFFDLIFTEFHTMPPACVCIQMCPEQSTYCYPNGCLRILERKKVEETTFVVNSVPKVYFEGTTKSATFGVGHKDIVDNFFDRPALYTSYRDMTDKSKMTDVILRSNPFKDLVFKYRKIPKLQMKYNLREQVRNKEAEKLIKEKNIDISKTRWPSNKHLLHGKSPFKTMHHYKKNDDIRQTKFLVSLFPDSEPVNYSPVFHKKYLTKRDNNNGVNVESLYLYKTDNANFTLETLVDSLIESSLDKSKKETQFSMNIEVNDAVNQVSSTENNINFTEINFSLNDDNDTNINIKNTAVSIVSMESTNENKDVNKYIHDMNMTNRNTFSEMITNMSEKIEIQNKVSLEFMERVTGKKIMMMKNKSSKKNITANNLHVTESVIIKNATTTDFITEKITSNEDFSTTTKPVPVTRASVYKKTKQRIRKPKRRNIN